MKPNTKKFFLFYVFVSILVFSLHSQVTKTSVFADVRFYYSYTRSLVFDHDLLLGNEFYQLGVLNQLPQKTFVPNPYPPGASIFWLPLFYLTTGFLYLLKLFIPGFNFSGYEVIFEYSVALTGIFLGIFGLYLIFKSLSKYFSEKVSIMATAVLFFATNVFFYIAVEPINSHAASFFISSLFNYYFFIRYPIHHSKLVSVSKEFRSYYFTLGLLGGVAGLIRTQDALLVTLPLICIFLRFRKSLTYLTTSLIPLATGAFIAFLPQLLLWKYFYNTFWYSPYFETGFNFLRPQIVNVLFNTQNGLFTVTPIVAVALIGLINYSYQSFKKMKFRIWNLFSIPNFGFGIYLVGFIYFILQLYLISVWNNTQGGSYSIRMIITTYPLLSFGLARILENAFKKIGDQKTLTFIVLFTVLNLFSTLN